MSERRTIDGLPAMDWVQDAVRRLSEMEEVKLMTRSSVFGYYDHNFLTIAQTFTPEQAASHPHHPNQRIWRVRAKEVVLAAGAFERPLIFPNNDVPGVMLASAVSSYVNRYAVVPGRKVVLFTNNDKRLPGGTGTWPRREQRSRRLSTYAPTPRANFRPRCGTSVSEW